MQIQEDKSSVREFNDTTKTRTCIKTFKISQPEDVLLNIFRLPKNQPLGSRTKSPLAVKYLLQTEVSRYSVFHSFERKDMEGVEAGGGRGWGL